jgi:ankyrin repeat protein
VAADLFTAVVFFSHEIPSLIAQGHDPNERQADGTSPLWTAARYDKPESVRRLLDGGADPNLPGFENQPPLACAAFCSSGSHEKENNEIAVMLIAAGADVNSRNPQYQETSLHFAVMSNNLALAKLLIENGADVNATMGMHGDTPLQYAVAGRNHEMVELLLATGASPEIANDVGFVPLQQAPEDNQMKMLFTKYQAK